MNFNKEVSLGSLCSDNRRIGNLRIERRIVREIIVLISWTYFIGLISLDTDS